MLEPHYLSYLDFEQLIKTDQLEIVIGRDPLLLSRAILAAIAEMESYLRGRFDVLSIFASRKQAHEDVRNPLLVMYGIDISLYHLHARINPKNISQIRFDRYKEAKLWLEMVSEGKLNPDLPALETSNEQGNGSMAWGGRSKHQFKRT